MDEYVQGDKKKKVKLRPFFFTTGHKRGRKEGLRKS